MYLAIIENNAIKTIGESRDLFPSYSFPHGEPPEDFLIEHSAVQIVQWEPFDMVTEKLIDSQPYLKDGKVYTYTKELKTAEELAADVENERIATEGFVREQRNQLLRNCDWTQVADAPVDKAAWATYRQELRDLTSQEGFPFNVVFPNPPL
jgi:hypothetical protein